MARWPAPRPCVHRDPWRAIQRDQRQQHHVAILLGASALVVKEGWARAVGNCGPLRFRSIAMRHRIDAPREWRDEVELEDALWVGDQIDRGDLRAGCRDREQNAYLPI